MGLSTRMTPEQGNAPHPEAHEQTVALITSSGSELVFQTHKDVGGVTYQIKAAGTVGIYDAGADKPAVVFGPHAWFRVMGDVHPAARGGRRSQIEPRVPTAI